MNALTHPIYEYGTRSKKNRHSTNYLHCINGDCICISVITLVGLSIRRFNDQKGSENVVRGLHLFFYALLFGHFFNFSYLCTIQGGGTQGLVTNRLFHSWCRLGRALKEKGIPLFVF